MAGTRGSGRLRHASAASRARDLGTVTRWSAADGVRAWSRLSRAGGAARRPAGVPWR